MFSGFCGSNYKNHKICRARCDLIRVLGMYCHYLVPKEPGKLVLMFGTVASWLDEDKDDDDDDDDENRR